MLLPLLIAAASESSIACESETVNPNAEKYRRINSIFALSPLVFSYASFKSVLPASSLSGRAVVVSSFTCNVSLSAANLSHPHIVKISAAKDTHDIKALNIRFNSFAPTFLYLEIGIL